MPKNVCVIGAGVSGLTSAIRLAETKHTVTIVTKEEGQDTTSSVAAAFWYPFWVDEEPVHDWYDPEWAAHTYRKLEELPRTSETGISKVRLCEYFERRMTDEEIDKVIDGMWWQKWEKHNWNLPGLDFQKDMSQQEVSLRRVRSFRFKRGISFQTFVINMNDYLSYLRQWAKRLQVDFEHREVDHAFDLLTQYDTVVNCSGMGAKVLVNDDRPDGPYGPHRLTASEGVVLRLTPLNEVRDISLVHTGPFLTKPPQGNYFGGKPLYIVPRSGTSPDIILGGSTTPELDFYEPERQSWKVQHLPWDSIPSDHWVRKYTNRIYADCCEFETSLPSATVLEAHVGYRPKPKPEVRVEREGNIIHNYGHGGAGVTLSWGCAERVAQLTEQN